MRKAIAVFALAGGLSVCAMAGEWTGYVMDQACAGKKEMQGNADCAKSCIKRGSPAVLVTSDGTVYKIANQDKVVDHAGEKVTVSGKMENGQIEVSSVK